VQFQQIHRNKSTDGQSVRKSDFYLKKDRHCTYKRNIEARSRKHFCRWKAISIAYSECVSVALIMQIAKRIRHIILIFVTCLSVPHFFPLYLIKSTVFGKKRLLSIKFVFNFSTTLSEIFYTLRIIQSNIIMEDQRPSFKIPVIFSYVNET
jgi:hypothetical protein